MLTIAEAADRLGLSSDAVYELCRAGRLAHYRVGARGGRLMIAEADLTVYLESCRVESATAKATQIRLSRLKHIKVK